MDVFWAAGYEGAAISDLERATGLRRSSIYNTFGSKRGLFDAAVEQYLECVIRPRLQPLRSASVGPEAIVAYLQGLRAVLADPASLSARSGCLLINTAGAPIGDDAAVAATVAAYRSELHDALARGIAARLPHLEVDAADRVTAACTGQVVAALALARIDRQGSMAAIDTALALVEAA